MNLSTVTSSFIETLLWQATCNGEITHPDHECRGEDCDSPMDDYYSESDFTPESIATIRSEVESFVESAREALPNTVDSLNAEMFGHDFCLTRNRHGAGFWDRGLGEVGDILTELSHPWGETYVNVNANGDLLYS